MRRLGTGRKTTGVAHPEMRAILHGMQTNKSTRARFSAGLCLHLYNGVADRAEQLGKVLAFGDSLKGIMAVKVVAVGFSPWGAWGVAAVHPTAAVRHRG